jgi:hypothetical protein
VLIGSAPSGADPGPAGDHRGGPQENKVDLDALDVTGYGYRWIRLRRMAGQ